MRRASRGSHAGGLLGCVWPPTNKSASESGGVTGLAYLPKRLATGVEPGAVEVRAGLLMVGEAKCRYDVVRSDDDQEAIRGSFF